MEKNISQPVLDYPLETLNEQREENEKAKNQQVKTQSKVLHILEEFEDENVSAMLLSEVKSQLDEVIKNDLMIAESGLLNCYLKLSVEQNPNHDFIPILRDLERYGSTSKKKIYVYTHPDVSMFCCSEIQGEIITKTGEIKPDPLSKKRKSYIIGVPLIYLTGSAPTKFLQGEIHHETGHALHTSFRYWRLINSQIELLAKDEMQKEHFSRLGRMLLNCVEDPRMERIVGGFARDNERRLLWFKNRLQIIPDIAENIRGSNPPEQLAFLLKLEGLWQIFSQFTENLEKPWQDNAINEDVLAEFEALKSSFYKLTGTAKLPGDKRVSSLESFILQRAWPAMERLLEKYPPQDKNQDQNKSQNKSQSSSGKENSSLSPEHEDMDPSNSETWDPETKKLIEKLKAEHQKRLEKDAAKVRADLEKKEEEKAKIRSKGDKIKSARDKFIDPEARKKYNLIKAKNASIIAALKNLWRQIPNEAEPVFRRNLSGNRFRVSSLIKHIERQTGRLLEKRILPKKPCLVLQLIIDISGSMEGLRLELAKEAVVCISESIKGRNVLLQVLASDDFNFSNCDPSNIESYLIKDFKDQLDGVYFERLLSLQARGGNRDADSIRASYPLLVKNRNRARSIYGSSAALGIFISDSTTRDADTFAAAEEARSSGLAFEGTAVSDEESIVESVKFNFGEKSIVPSSLSDLPNAFSKILEMSLLKLKGQG